MIETFFFKCVDLFFHVSAPSLCSRCCHVKRLLLYSTGVQRARVQFVALLAVPHGEPVGGRDHPWGEAKMGQAPARLAAVHVRPGDRGARGPGHRAVDVSPQRAAQGTARAWVHMYTCVQYICIPV